MPTVLTTTEKQLDDINKKVATAVKKKARTVSLPIKAVQTYMEDRKILCKALEKTGRTIK